MSGVMMRLPPCIEGVAFVVEWVQTMYGHYTDTRLAEEPHFQNQYFTILGAVAHEKKIESMKMGVYHIVIRGPTGFRSHCTQCADARHDISVGPKALSAYTAWLSSCSRGSGVVMAQSIVSQSIEHNWLRTGVNNIAGTTPTGLEAEDPQIEAQTHVGSSPRGADGRILATNSNSPTTSSVAKQESAQDQNISGASTLQVDVMLKKEKIGVGIAMSMSVFAGITALIQTSSLHALESPDIHDAVQIIYFGAMEIATTIVGVSIPILRTLIRDTNSSVRDHSKKSGDDTLGDNGTRKTKGVCNYIVTSIAIPGMEMTPDMDS
ncbi:hypothetical protein G7Y89_g11175 [Cudoniella acicularis]|uniref:Uncharacterized protein n=1 Tax=Cudoniella acicularis TaxID=354080 RepID=A0A8H4RE04_9HELO|nr:hypothetical protein G7Y89_g11175 [Cudoniella acicularis]